MPELGRAELDGVTLTAHGTEPSAPAGYCLATRTSSVCKANLQGTVGDQRFLFDAVVVLDGDWWHFGHHSAGLSTLTYEPVEGAVTQSQDVAGGTYFATRVSPGHDTVRFEYRSNVGDNGYQVLSKPF